MPLVGGGQLGDPPGDGVGHDDPAAVAGVLLEEARRRHRHEVGLAGALQGDVAAPAADQPAVGHVAEGDPGEQVVHLHDDGGPLLLQQADDLQHRRRLRQLEDHDVGALGVHLDDLWFGVVGLLAHHGGDALPDDDVDAEPRFAHRAGRLVDAVVGRTLGPRAGEEDVHVRKPF
jgi:hypothetical protein